MTWNLLKLLSVKIEGNTHLLPLIVVPYMGNLQPLIAPNKNNSRNPKHTKTTVATLNSQISTNQTLLSPHFLPIYIPFFHTYSTSITSLTVHHIPSLRPKLAIFPPPPEPSNPLNPKPALQKPPTPKFPPFLYIPPQPVLI